MDHLIDWERVPDDPMYQLTFSQAGMLSSGDYATIARLVRDGAPPQVITAAANRIRFRLNPQPGGQKTHNVPTLHGRKLPGLQHKYAETILFFPKRGQTCHVYCTYCFRWAQFLGKQDIRFAATTTDEVIAYLREHPAITDVLITGGDPLMMKTPVLAKYIEPLLGVEQINSIRIGTKALATWPHRFLSSEDADAALRLFEQVVASGRHLALMSHYSHPVELSTDMAQQAARRVISTGANIRMQSPVAHHINDDPTVWANLWRSGVRLGCIPYYMFVVRDTGAHDYFELPLIRTWEIFQGAYRQVSGLARTVRGPTMSAFPGKVHIIGIAEVSGRKVFVLQYLQARDPKVVRRPFFARFDPAATWFDQLQPATNADEAFFPVHPSSPGEPAQ
jgi:KamA family protein